MEIEKIAGFKQFEANLLQTMLKSMRMAEHFNDNSNPFRVANTGQGSGFAAMLTITPIAPKTNTGEQSIATTANTKVDEFIDSIWPYAQQAASRLGLDPKLLLAQAALETGWGRYVNKNADGSSSNNFFNIKAFSAEDGDVVQVKTTEFIANNAIKVNAAFKRYSSIENSFNDYVSLIKNNQRYANALANTANPERYIDELGRAGYATDPQYAAKILSIYHGDELQRALDRMVFLCF